MFMNHKQPLKQSKERKQRQGPAEADPVVSYPSAPTSILENPVATYPVVAATLNTINPTAAPVENAAEELA